METQETAARCIKIFDLIFGIVFDQNFDGFGDTHDSWGDFIEVLTNAMFK